MFDRFSESELLAYIEDDLDASERAELAARLDEAHPQARAVLDRMREDRTLLRSAAEPELPVDFLVELEPQLARPMLMDQRPGTYRRRHHRRRSGVRLVRYAAAAVLLVACFAAIWYVATLGVVGPGETPGEGIAANIDDDATGGSAGPESIVAVIPSDEIVEEGDWPPPDTVIWHERPLPPSIGEDALASAAGGGSDPAPGSASPGDGPGVAPTFAATFALVLAGEDAAEAEALMGRVLTRLSGDEPPGRGPDAALVQNLTYEEATALARRYNMQRGDGRPDRFASVEGPPATAAARRSELLRTLGRIQRQRAAAEEDEIRISRQLLGPKALAASYGRQLEFSEAGATHTITVPASKLAELLQRLRLDEGRTTALRPLPSDDGEGEAPGETASEGDSLSQWVTDLATLNAFLAALRTADEAGAYVLLPVVVEAEGR